jgi:Kef-type K+ transport system membrane component KefB
MEQAISLVITLGIFALVVWGISWVCARFGMPPPVLWICGGLVLIIMLYYLAHLVSGGAAPMWQYHRT